MGVVCFEMRHDLMQFVSSNVGCVLSLLDVAQISIGSTSTLKINHQIHTQ